MTDPAAEQQSAVEKSTGALLREALEANQELVVENERLRFELMNSSDAGIRLSDRLVTANAEIARLKSQIPYRPGPYWLTGKALAALAANEKE